MGAEKDFASSLHLHPHGFFNVGKVVLGCLLKAVDHWAFSFLLISNFSLFDQIGSPDQFQTEAQVVPFHDLHFVDHPLGSLQQVVLEGRHDVDAVLVELHLVLLGEAVDGLLDVGLFCVDYHSEMGPVLGYEPGTLA